MTFVEDVETRKIMLAEGAVYERLRRHPDIAFDPAMRHGVLIYDPKGSAILADIHRGYMAAARAAGLPLILLSDTWRANAENIARSRFAGRPVNQDNVAMLKRLRAASGQEIFIGGLLGCRGDAYRPQEALQTSEAYAFHRPQAQALAEAKPDFLMASTLPALSEAQGLAQAMAETGLPYLVSFVLRPSGVLLDGTDWAEAIAALDALPHPPIGHAANCIHPNVLTAALEVLTRRDAALTRRLIFFQANTSVCSPEELACATELKTEEPDALAARICAVQRQYGIPIVGGCCGTDQRHIAALGAMLTAQTASI